MNQTEPITHLLPVRVRGGKEEMFVNAADMAHAAARDEDDGCGRVDGDVLLSQHGQFNELEDSVESSPVNTDSR